jgi:hypothetical protein
MMGPSIRSHFFAKKREFLWNKFNNLYHKIILLMNYKFAKLK